MLQFSQRHPPPPGDSLISIFLTAATRKTEGLRTSSRPHISHATLGRRAFVRTTRDCGHGRLGSRAGSPTRSFRHDFDFPSRWNLAWPRGSRAGFARKLARVIRALCRFSTGGWPGASPARRPTIAGPSPRSSLSVGRGGNSMNHRAQHAGERHDHEMKSPMAAEEQKRGTQHAARRRDTPRNHDPQRETEEIVPLLGSSDRRGDVLLSGPAPGREIDRRVAAASRPPRCFDRDRV